MKPRKPPEPTPLLDYVPQASADTAKRLAALKTERKLEGRRERRRRKEHGGGSQGSAFRMSVSILRLHDLRLLIRHRCDGPATTDDADVFLRVALPSLVEGMKRARPQEVRAAVLRFRERSTPAVSEVATLAMLHEVEVDRLRGRKVHFSADQAAKILRVSAGEMAVLGLKTINAVGIDKAKRKAMAKDRDRVRKAVERAKAGAKPHAKSNEATKPWLALGIGRATFYTRLKAGLVARGADGTWTVSSAIGSLEPQPTWTDLSNGPDPLQMGTLPPPPPKVGEGASPFAGMALSDAAQRLVQGPARTGRTNRLDGAGGHTPMATAKAVVTVKTVAQPFPEEGIGRTLDLFCDGPAGDDPQRLDAVALKVVEEVRQYRGGLLPPVVAMAVRDALKARGLRHEDFGRAIGVSRMQATNVLAGRFGLSPSAALNLRTWYEAAAA